MTHDAQTEVLLDKLDGSGSSEEWKAVEELRKIGKALPKLLLARFCQAQSWRVRSSCVYHATRYARDSEDAVQLGLLAIEDRSKMVRYRGCMLLAYAQNRHVLSRLRGLLADPKVASGREDLSAAIDAIESGNANYFVDREHSGKVKMTIS